MKNYKKQKAQGAIEYLLIIGAAILVVAIVILAVTGALGSAKQDANSTLGDVNGSLNELRNTGGNETTPTIEMVTEGTFGYISPRTVQVNGLGSMDGTYTYDGSTQWINSTNGNYFIPDQAGSWWVFYNPSFGGAYYSEITAAQSVTDVSLIWKDMDGTPVTPQPTITGVPTP